MKLFLLILVWLAFAGLFSFLAGAFLAFGLKTHDEREQREGRLHGH